MKRPYILMWLALFAPACGNDLVGPPPPPPPIPPTVTSVTISPETVTVDIRETIQLTPTVLGTGAFDHGVIWSVSGECVISLSGLVQGTDVATTCIATARSIQDSTKSGSATVRVVKFDKIAFTRADSIPSARCSWGVCQEIYLQNLDGTRLRRLTTTTLNQDLEPAWSPDGKKIAFGRNGGCSNGVQSIYVVNVDGSDTVNVSQCQFGGAGPSWSPDGEKIAFMSYDTGESPKKIGIAVMNADGSGHVRLTSIICDGGCSPDWGPSWSPDGTKIAFTTNRDGNWEVYVMNPDGSGLTNLSNHSASDAAPVFSPDGSRIAFNSNRDGKNQIYVMDAGGSNQVRLTSDPIGALDPAWSPDGTRIAYSGGCCEVSTMDIYVMNADGTNPTNITKTASLPERFPAWRP